MIWNVWIVIKIHSLKSDGRDYFLVIFLPWHYPRQTLKIFLKFLWYISFRYLIITQLNFAHYFNEISEENIDRKYAQNCEAFGVCVVSNPH